jgi:hypothetical protein
MHQGDYIVDNNMGGTCITHRETKHAYTILV